MKQRVRSQAMLRYRYNRSAQHDGQATTPAVMTRRAMEAAVGGLDLQDVDKRETAFLWFLEHFCPGLVCIGSNTDPFGVMPTFQNMELDSLALFRLMGRVWVNKSTLLNWLPVLMPDPRALLSAALMCTTWLDMCDGSPGNSRRTNLIRAEVTDWTNQFLRDPATRDQDGTLMLVLHLLMGEIWSCDEKALRIHMAGLTELMALGASARARANEIVGYDILGLTTIM